jgi:hypothetical protein
MTTGFASTNTEHLGREIRRALRHGPELTQWLNIAPDIPHIQPKVTYRSTQLNHS